jgi:hypothetical protein
MTDGRNGFRCVKCWEGDHPFRYADFFERLRLADDPADPNVGHFYLETIHVMRCRSCGRLQEHLHQRTPYATLREAQSQLDAHLLGKG